ncbi:ATP-binding protein [bacterium]|nr:ATP-binding protein [bacterium]
MMVKDRVTLSVPSRPEYAKAVRMTAAVLVSRTDLAYDEVDDVRMAAEEAFVYACDTSGSGGQVEMEFTIEESRFSICVTLGDGNARVADEDGERRAAYATFILESVCDRFEMSSDEKGTHLTVVKNLPTGSSETPEPTDADG